MIDLASLFNTVAIRQWCRCLVSALVLLLAMAWVPSTVLAGQGSNSASENATLKAAIPAMVMVWVNPNTSQLHHDVAQENIGQTNNTVAKDYKIKGFVLSNSSSSLVQCTVDKVIVPLENNGDTINVRLRGRIGSTKISTTPFFPTFINNRANISIRGDLDETTITNQHSPGLYSGTFTITATII